ncbi:hypothetical protein OQ267_13360 [Pedobacter sp. MR22-3]|nr:hypothetical protein [Pedobacter sp. MR22-3]
MSSILLKVINKDKIIEIFTIEASILSTASFLVSVVYYFLLKWEVNAQRIKFENNYADVKRRYTDLIDEQDINRILKNDHELESDTIY